MHVESLCNPAIGKSKHALVTSLYDFRHYFCTKTLRDSGDPFFTMCQMGHKKLTTTQLYMHLVNLENDEWTCRAATTKEEAMSLIEGGFQYVTTIEGIQLFKKRK